MSVLKAAGVVSQTRPQYLLTGRSRDGGAQHGPLLIQAMLGLAEKDPNAFDQRSEELAYLTNVLVSGCSHRQRRLRPIEALRAVIATCSLGLWLSIQDTKAPRRGHDVVAQALTILERLPADGLFRVAWHQLHCDVVDRAAEVAERWLAHAIARSAPEDRANFAKAHGALRKARADAAPWKAVHELDSLIGMIDAKSVDVLCDLVDECPELPARRRAKSRRIDRQDGCVHLVARRASRGGSAARAAGEGVRRG